MYTFQIRQKMTYVSASPTDPDFLVHTLKFVLPFVDKHCLSQMLNISTYLETQLFFKNVSRTTGTLYLGRLGNSVVLCLRVISPFLLIEYITSDIVNIDILVYDI